MKDEQLEAPQGGNVCFAFGGRHGNQKFNLDVVENVEDPRRGEGLL